MERQSVEWDDARERANRRQHGVDFRTAANVFLDPFAIETDDLDSHEEQRFKIIGMAGSRILLVVFTWRGDAIRIISARGAEPHERKRDHENST